MRPLHRPLVAILCLLGVGASAEEWRVGLGPEVFAEPGDAPATRFGGWFDASYEDSDEAPSAGALNHLNGFADTRWQSFQLFVEAEYEHERSLAGFEEEHQLELEQAYVRWQASEAFGVRAGRFNTPFGWWVPIHWSILMDSVTPPLHVGTEMIPEQQVGLELAGRLFPPDLAGLDSELSWSLFSGYGGDGLDTEAQGPTVGGDVRLRLAERYLLGTSLYRQENDEFEDRRELSNVLFGEARLPLDLTLRSEYVQAWRDHTAGYDDDADSFYASLRWDAHRFVYLAYRFGYGDVDDEDALVTRQRGVHTFTLGLLPHPDVRVKLEYNHNELSGGTPSEFDHWVVSLGYLF